ncbi:MAG: glycerol-3-phosphate acyltransferase [Spirochaetae bacterium HGW-Spirochaetae-9]|nr:MAG: glycerol-3-phosphate acyltransferase [Spirochaetae bacterium HGW-Spirochaetae-9]
MMDSIRDRYMSLIARMLERMKKQKEISDEDVFQAGDAGLLPLIDPILIDHLQPGSKIDGFANLEDLMARAKKGESCLLLLEHYSNFDLPAFHYLLRESKEGGRQIAEALIAIAGVKLSEANPVVSAFAQAYSRIIIYPSRSIEILKKNLKDPTKLYREMMRGMSINRAAVRALGKAKVSGKILLVFPAGTRYRPWDPGSKRGVREIASYIKGFENFCLVAVNGNILRINPKGEMEDDLLENDKVVFTVSPVQKSEDFLKHIDAEHHFRDDKKQEIVDHLMEDLEIMHIAAEKKRSQSQP